MKLPSLQAVLGKKKGFASRTGRPFLSQSVDFWHMDWRCEAAELSKNPPFTFILLPREYISKCSRERPLLTGGDTLSFALVRRVPHQHA